MIIKILIATLVLWLISRVYDTIKGYQEYRYYKKQGVVFTDNTWSFTRDIRAMITVI
jgi:hypothetical protein